MIETLPRREREVFETLCRLQTGTTSAVRAAMGGSLSDSAVRTLLARLETKGLVSRESHPDGVLFRPSPRPEAIAASALRRTVDTFFAGSAASAATALLGLTQKLKPEELEALERAIGEARERGS
jgi:predicted transcriptional regulator